MLWLDLREEEFDRVIQETGGICILPVGSIEKHGQHLPVGTDSFLAEEFSKRASEIESAVVFPTFCCGAMFGAGDCRGTVILSPQLMMQMLEEFCDEIGRNGFRKIIVVSGHGGNGDWLKFFTGTTLYKKKDYVVYFHNIQLGYPQLLLEGVCNGTLKTKLTEEEIEILKEHARPGAECGHGCIAETAAILGLKPHTVRLDRADDSGHSTERMAWRGTTPLTSLGWRACYPNSFAGENPKDCTMGIAEAEVEYMTKEVAEIIKRVKEDKVALVVNEERNVGRL